MLARLGFQHLTGAFGIVDVGRVYDHVDQVAQGVDHDMSLSILDLLAPVSPALLAWQDRLDALGVDDGVAWRLGLIVFFDAKRSTRRAPSPMPHPSSTPVSRRTPCQGGKLLGNIRHWAPVLLR